MMNLLGYISGLIMTDDLQPELRFNLAFPIVLSVSEGETHGASWTWPMDPECEGEFKTASCRLPSRWSV
jgi:hypothetical protein